MREELRNCAKYSFHPFGYLHIRVNSCTGRSLLSPFLSSLKLILGNSFQVSVIRIEYARYSCEYRIRKASQEYLNTFPSLIFLPLSSTLTVLGVLMCVPQSAVYPPSQPSELLKNLHSFNFPSSLLDRYSAGSFDVHSTNCSSSPH